MGFCKVCSFLFFYTRKVRIRNDNVRKSWVASIVEKMVETGLRWFVHVERRLVDFVVRRVDQMEDSQITRG